ncbi:tyrosine--tRNA ligase [Portibacter marinus]|uniref:tyrosine--tRNA ligase n=1 Tax=Portibacter marinus TaxID=2898660 RepID=UPI001F002867|nr:tyrosine--tRNA ligase [Portibacter marinus]
MNFIDELRWRGMLHDMTPGVEDLLSNESVVGYIGFDPTAPSMTIGNYVQIMLLTLFQKHGHTPIVLMGGATGRIGDPSGKDQERQLKSYEELDSNLEFQKKQAEKFLDFEHRSNAARLVNNLDFYKDMNVLDFLRIVGKNLTVNYMLSKDSVKNRLESGLSFTEFSYQLLQAYDFLCLFRQENCVLQMGGSDQWGNITSGTEFIRRNTEEGKAHAVTTPLLTKADGSKFGKSTEGNIWLDPEMTSPYKFYQFWINAADDDIGKYMRYFTLKSREEVESIEKEYADNPQAYKRILAEELTRRIHGDEDYEAVLNVSELLFNKKAGVEYVQKLDVRSLRSISKEIPSYEISASDLSNGIAMDELLTEKASVFNSKSEVRRAVKSNAVALNKEKVKDFDQTVTTDDTLHGQYILGENGKKNQFILQIV